MSAQEKKLPELGEGVLEGELVKWLVKPGDQFKNDQPLCEVMTDKATVEIPSLVSGTVVSLIAKEGTVLKVGAPLLNFESSAQPAASKSVATTASSRASTPQPMQATTHTPSSIATAATVTRATTLEPASGHAFVRSSPSVRKKAAELGINLLNVTPSGPQNRVLMNDVLNFTPGKTTLTTTSTGSEERIPLKGLRKAIAKQMTLSKFTATHFTYVDEADVTKLVRLRNYAKELGAKKGLKVTYLPFIVKAAIAALREFPLLNASLDEQRQEIILKRYYNIGIAVATEEGLIVPNIKNADKMSIFQLSKVIAEKSAAANEGKSKLEDLKNGTFTITNIGGIGGLFATPIINYPEVAILGVNKIVRRPVIKEKRVVARDMTYFSISLDHRVVDGAVAAQFMNVFIKYLESPELLMLSEEL